MIPLKLEVVQNMRHRRRHAFNSFLLFGAKREMTPRFLFFIFLFNLVVHFAEL